MASEKEKRMPPHTEEAERGALGALIKAPLRLLDIAMNSLGLKPDAFYLPAHRLICQTLYDMAADKDKARFVDIITLTETLRTRGDLDEVGGTRYLEDLVLSCTTDVYGEHYLDLVRQKFIARRIIEVCRMAELAAYDVDRAEELLQKVPQWFIEIIGDEIVEESNFDVMNDLIGKWRNGKDEEARRLAGNLSVPWPRMNKLMFGLEPGVTIVAGRPSDGKTTFEDCVCDHVAKTGAGVFRVCMDALRPELLGRAMARKAGVSLPKLKSGHAGEAQMAQVEEARDLLATYPMYFARRGMRDLRSICTAIRSAQMKLEKKSKYGLRLVTVDFVQQITVSEMGKNQWDKNSRVGFAIETINQLCDDLGIASLVLSQLSRASEKEDRDAKLSDLRDSGELEQSADKVGFLRRDRSLCKEADDSDDYSELTKTLRPTWFDLLKQKDGATGSVPLWLYPHYFRFDEAGPHFADAENVGWPLDLGEKKTPRAGGARKGRPRKLAAEHADAVLNQMEAELVLPE